MPALPTRPFNTADYPRLTELCQNGYTVPALAKELDYTRAQVQNALSRLCLRATPMCGAVNPAHSLIPDSDTIWARFKVSPLEVREVATRLHINCFQLNRELRGLEPIKRLRRKKLARLLEMAAAKVSS